MELAKTWRTVAEFAGVCRMTMSGAGIRVVQAPTVSHVEFGPDHAITLTVKALPGQLTEDLADVGRRLAEGMGAAVVQVRPFRYGFHRVSLLRVDPLKAVLAAARPVASALDPLLLGIAEDAAIVTLELATSAHLIAQGATGSGKSMATYSLLAQLTDAPDIRVTGVDPTALVLGPWANRWRDVPAPALGTADPLAYVLTLDAVVREMDKRTGAMPAGRDSVELGTACPVLLVVLEEHPAVLRILDTTDPKLAKTYRALVARVLSEGRKAGIRVLLLSQRADAAIVGAFERGQSSHRLSYRVDSPDGLKMLHPDVTPDAAATHSSALPGIALASVPGSPLLRLRSPYLPYQAYWEAVSPASPPRPALVPRQQHAPAS